MVVPEGGWSPDPPAAHGGQWRMVMACTVTECQGGGAGDQHRRAGLEHAARRRATAQHRHVIFRMLTARATTRIADHERDGGLGHHHELGPGLDADTSVGLKAVAVAKAKWK